MKLNKKYVALVTILCLLPVIGFGFQWFFKSISSKSVQYKTLKVDAEFNEDLNVNEESVGLVPGDKIAKKVSINPKSTTDSFIRVKVNKRWAHHTNEASTADNIGLIYDEISGNSVVINPNKEDIDLSKEDYRGKWYLAEDNYLYYLDVVNSDTGEIPLIKELEFIGNKIDNSTSKIEDFQDKTLKFNVNMDVVQVKHDAFISKWDLNESSKIGKALIEIAKEGTTESKICK